MTDIRIVPASVDDDFAAVAAVYLTTWRAAYRGMVPAAYLASLTAATWHPERRVATTFLAKTARGETVGVCAYGPARRPERAGQGEVYSLYVLPAYQGQGVGGRLLDAALARLTQPTVYLVVLEANANAQRLYTGRGFACTGERVRTATPYGPLDEIIMQR
ncbi:GNAT family N-acetyltransferase [Lacticaseibacillus kribbianus]|uniref:GNAT family N-acetyltransferase n=1 Tax=Lacticaseibacillus kribbianus TaxID=2926292 RepID=UPI001CD51F4A|nr:N-acetyltransferase [Lacticaseibacillus kribbianus]